MYIFIYVDDVIPTVNDPTFIQSILQHLSSQFFYQGPRFSTLLP
jgi:hypothetical protein